MNYGELNFGIVISLYETNLAESKEYLSLLSVKQLSIFSTYVLLFVVIIFLNKSIQTSNNHKKMAWFCCLFVLSIIWKPIKHGIDKKELSFSLAKDINYYPIRFVSDFSFFSYEYFQSKIELQQSLQRKATWKITEINQPYKNYVLVIGESMQRLYVCLWLSGSNDAIFKYGQWYYF